MLLTLTSLVLVAVSGKPSPHITAPHDLVQSRRYPCLRDDLPAAVKYCARRLCTCVSPGTPRTRSALP